MFCKNCGQELASGATHCPTCGTDNTIISQFTEAASDTFSRAEEGFSEAVNSVKSSFSSNDTPPRASVVERLQTNRSLLVFLLLSFITCGFYSWFFFYKWAKDVNTACEGDGESTDGLVKFLLLSICTCGIYQYYWYYKLGNRLATNAPRYGLNFQENGSTVLLWFIVGAVACGIGPFIAWHILIKNTNKICDAYNRYNGV